MKQAFTDEDILAAVAQGGKALNTVMTFLYHRSGSKEQVVSFVQKHGGNRQDGEDVFHEGLRHLIMNLRNGKVDGKCTLLSFSHVICKNVWFNHFNRGIHFNTIKDKMNSGDKEMASPEHLYISREGAETMRELLLEIGEGCKKVLGLWSLNYSFKEIAAMLGKSESAARKQKHDCLKKLVSHCHASQGLIKRLKDLFK